MLCYKHFNMFIFCLLHKPTKSSLGMKTSPRRNEHTTSAISEIAFTEITNLICSKLTLLNYKKHIILFRAVFMLRVILTPEFHIFVQIRIWS